jgi:hypothetical protein
MRHSPGVRRYHGHLERNVRGIVTIQRAQRRKAYNRRVRKGIPKLAKKIFFEDFFASFAAFLGVLCG